MGDSVLFVGSVLRGSFTSLSVVKVSFRDVSNVGEVYGVRVSERGSVCVQTAPGVAVQRRVCQPSGSVLFRASASSSFSGPANPVTVPSPAVGVAVMVVMVVVKLINLQYERDYKKKKKKKKKKRQRQKQKQER